MLFDLGAVRLSHEFGGFIHGPRLSAAVMAARRTACGEGSAYLWGKPGSGKTHLLKAAANEARRNDIELVKINGELPHGPSLTVIDDITELEPDELQWIYEILKTVLQGQPNSSVLIAGPQVPASLGLRDDVRTRISELPCFHLSPLDDSELQEALCSHAGRLGRELPESVAKVLVERLPRDMASLSQAMDRLDAHVIANDVKLTVSVAQKWLDSKGVST